MRFSPSGIYIALANSDGQVMTKDTYEMDVVRMLLLLCLLLLLLLCCVFAALNTPRLRSPLRLYVGR